MRSNHNKFIIGMKYCNPAKPNNLSDVVICQNDVLYNKLKTSTNDPSITKAMRRSQLMRHSPGTKSVETTKPVVNDLTSNLPFSRFIKINVYIEDAYVTKNSIKLNITGTFCTVNVYYRNIINNIIIFHFKNINSNEININNLLPNTTYEFTITPFAYGFQGSRVVIRKTTKVE